LNDRIAPPQERHPSVLRDQREIAAGDELLVARELTDVPERSPSRDRRADLPRCGGGLLARP
jgi:hypothetical protein